MVAAGVLFQPALTQVMPVNIAGRNNKPVIFYAG
jgi:hypothetical protein